MYQVITRNEASQLTCITKNRTGERSLWHKGQRYKLDSPMIKHLDVDPEKFEDVVEVLAYYDPETKLATPHIEEFYTYMKGKSFQLFVAGKEILLHVAPSKEWQEVRPKSLKLMELKHVWMRLKTSQTLTLEPTEEEMEDEGIEFLTPEQRKELERQRQAKK